MATLVVSSGFTFSGVTLNPGDQEVVLAGGAAFNTVVSTGASLIVSSGGDADRVSVSLQGGTVQDLGGTVSSAVFAASGFFDMSTGGGKAVETSLGSGSFMLLGPSAVASSTLVNNFAVISSQQGTTEESQIYGGGFEYDGAQAVAIGATIFSGGEQFDDYGATTSGSIISSGGIQLVDTGATASGTDVRSGGKLIVLPGGAAMGAIVEAGGVVQSGGVVELSGQAVMSSFAGSTIGGAIYTGSAFVLSGGGLFSASVSDAEVGVYSGGVVDALNIAGGGDVTVYSGGTTQNALVDWDQSASGSFSNAGHMTIVSGGSAFGTVLDACPPDLMPLGQAVFTVLSGGYTSGTVVSSGGLLVLANGAATNATEILDGGEIDLSGLEYSPFGTANLNDALNTLSINEDNTSTTLSLAGSYSGQYFHLSDDGGGGTLVTVDETPCFCRGTLIETENGEVAIERLRVGDKIKTVGGGFQHLRWIGSRSHSSEAVIADPSIAPIRFRAGCLDRNVPKRDLRVSPNHAIFADGVLVPARALVNGVNVLTETDPGQVQYFHVEFDEHEVVLAEGAPAESYIEDGDRAVFTNADDYEKLYPGRPKKEARYCAPRLQDGFKVQQIRERLSMPRTTPLADQFCGVIDHVSREKIVGWAINMGRPDERQLLRVLHDGLTVGIVKADMYRGDLKERGLGDGRCAFEYVIPNGLSPGVQHLLEVQRAHDGRALHSSPRTFMPQHQNLADPAIGPLRGRLDAATRDSIKGWADCPSAPGQPVELQISDNGALIGVALANGWRQDVADSGLNSGWCGFELIIPGGLPPTINHNIHVRRSSDGVYLPGSPTVIPHSESFDEALRETIRQAVSGLLGVEPVAQALTFLQEQCERIRQINAESDNERNFRQAQDYLRTRRGLNLSKSRPRALIIDSRYPDVTRDGGSVALISHIRALTRLGYDVSFVAADQMVQAASLPAGCEISYLHWPFYTCVENVLIGHQGTFDLVYLHRAHVAENYLALARRHMPQAHVIYSVADLHHVRLERQAMVEKSSKWLKQSQIKRVMEHNSARLADSVVTHSWHEAGLLRAAVPDSNIHVVRWAVPNIRSRKSFASRAGVAFLGNFEHAPNVDAARFLLSDIMPLIWRVAPDLPCFIAGCSALRAVGKNVPVNVKVLGHLPDLRVLWTQVRVSIAPLRFGAGLKVKVVESMASGIPCIMTPIAAEGFRLSISLQTLVAASAPALAAAVLRLHQSSSLNRAAVRAGHEFVERFFCESDLDETLGSAIEGNRLKRPKFVEHRHRPEGGTKHAGSRSVEPLAAGSF